MHGSIYDHPALPPLARPASRLIVRLLAEMQLAATQEVSRALGEIAGQVIPIDRMIFTLMVLRQHPRFQGSARGQATAPEAATGISVNAMATSLQRPFETVRRHVNTLIDLGLLTRQARGVTLAPGVIDTPRFVTMLHRLHDGMVSFIDDMARFDIDLPKQRPDAPYNADATTAAAIDLSLSPFELLGTSYRNPLELAIVNVTIIVGARGYAFDPVLSHRYAEVDTVPPESLRHPVSVTALAKGLRISYATARREIDQQVRLGRLKRVAGGVIATEAFLSNPVIVNGSQHAAQRASQILRRLVPSGFCFDDPPSCYLDGRPPLAPY